MIYEYLIDFGPRVLKLKTNKEVKQKHLKNIHFILDEFLSELNHNVKNSSAEKFNSAQTNIPIYLKKEFIDFLEYNIDFYQYFSNIFNPTNIQSGINIRKYYKGDIKHGNIIKLKNFKLDTSFLRSVYILELLKNYLSEEKIKDYEINLPNIIVSKGDQSWESRFKDSDSFFNQKFNLRNKNALLIKRSPDHKKRNKFGAADNKINGKEYIIIGKDLGILKSLEDYVSKLTYKTELIKASKRFKVDIVSINNDEVGVFKGIS